MGVFVLGEWFKSGCFINGIPIRTNPWMRFDRSKKEVHNLVSLLQTKTLKQGRKSKTLFNN
jgi:hypothetical protein